MNDTLEILVAIERLRDQGKRFALATIVGVQGSAYRGAGARLLVSETGETVGTISGGCLEGDLEKQALEVVDDGQARLLNFDLRADDEAVWGWGLGCNGAIEVLLEPGDRLAIVAGSLRKGIEANQSLAAVTVLDGDGQGVERGRRLLVHPDGSTEGDLGRADLNAEASARAREALAAGRPATAMIGSVAAEPGGVRLFVEILEPPLRLVVCGAGHDAIPLVRYGAELGWRTTVVDDRSSLLNADRFPEASEFIHVDRPHEAATVVGTDRRTCAMIMTHHYLRDLDYLRSFLGTDVCYLGVLGPRRRFERLLHDLAQQGVRPSQEQLTRIHAPAGLDLGSDGPQQIAWSVVAEILAVTGGRGGGSLRDRQGPIHASHPPAELGSTR